MRLFALCFPLLDERAHHAEPLCSCDHLRRNDFVRSAQIQSLMPRVCATTTAETMAGSAFAPSEQVEITTVQGKVLASEPIVFAKGSKERPLSHDELQAKFSDCLGDDFGGASKSKAFEKLMNLERLNSAADLLSL